MLGLDHILLSRIQFAFTVSFHIIFPSLSIGLASFLTVLSALWLKTKNQHYRDLYLFWVKVFAVTFGMGVVSGVVMSYEFGTNWSLFSDKVSNVIGPLLGFEVLTAFFLEASFLGIMLFGYGRVSNKMHFAATFIVAIGTLISAFWILSANSWMQTPQGYSTLSDGRLVPLNWLEIIFNPSFPYRLLHMVTAAYLSTAFMVGGVASVYLLKQRHLPHAKIMLFMSTLMAFIVAPIQLVIGDAHGLNTLQYQPAKVAAMEGLWEGKDHVPLVLFAVPDQEKRENHAAIEIPSLASLILTHKADGYIKGLNEFGENIPPVATVFYSFRLMVAIGILMIVTGVTSMICYFRRSLYQARWLQRWWVLMSPTGVVAVLCGWFVTEVGRQPYAVYGVIKTAEAASAGIVGEEVLWSLALFVLVYTLIFGSGSYYITKLIRKGIEPKADNKEYYKDSKYASVIEAVSPLKGEDHV